MEIPDQLIEALLPAVEQQLESSETPFVRKAWERLSGREDCSEQEARELIAQALAIATNRIMTSGRPFDVSYYKELLALLPALPDEGN